MCIYKCMLNVYKNQQNRQTGSRNLTGPKTLPTIWYTYMTLVTKYQQLLRKMRQTDRGKTVYPLPSGSGGIKKLMAFRNFSFLL